MDFANFILFIIALIVVVSTSQRLYHNGIRTYTLFLFLFFLCLLLNTTKLSIYQKEKNELDLYYLLLGPSILASILYIADRFRKIKIPHYNLFNVNIVFLSLFVIYIAVKLYISSIVGWRIDSILASTLIANGDNYSVPGFTGLASSIQWVLLMLCPLLRKKWKWMAYAFCVALTVFAILHVKRGDVMRMLVFFLVLYLYKNFNGKHKTEKKKNVNKALIIVGLIFSIFVISGNMRQHARGDEIGQRVRDSGLTIKNETVAWLYSYFAFNIDVLRLYYNLHPKDEPNALNSIMYGGDTEEKAYAINGFNAATFLRTFISDYQELFFIELLPFSLIIGIFAYLSRLLKYHYLYIFICSILVFAPFGNYFEARAIPVGMFIFFIVSLFIKDNRVRNTSNIIISDVLLRRWGRRKNIKKRVKI